MAIGSRPKVTDVAIQDLTSPIIDCFLTRKLGTATLAAPTAFEDRTITLVAGHGFTAGEMIEIDNNDTRFYQSKVHLVVGNVVTVNNPLCYAFPVTANVKRTSPNMNINGATTPIIFSAKTPVGVQWDINILSIDMLDNAEMDDSLFGGIPALTNGVCFRTVDGTNRNIFTALDNGSFRRHCDTDNPYSEKSPSGVHGFNAKRYFNGQGGDGAARRIGGPEIAEFQAVVADNLTGLTRFWCVIRGHVVESPVAGDKTRVTLTDEWQAITSVGQSATVWLMGNSEVMITSSATGTPDILTAYPLYRGTILQLEPDEMATDVFYARCLGTGCTTGIVVDVIG